MPLTFPNPVFPSDVAVEALDGTTHQRTGLVFVPKGAGPTSSPTLEVPIPPASSSVTARATASQPNPMLILRDRAHGAAQVLRPISDISVAFWVNELGSAVNLAPSIDEAKPDDDATWIETSVWQPFFIQQYTMALAPGVDPLRDADHTIFFRAKKVGSGNSNNILQFIVRLIDAMTGSVIHVGGAFLETAYQDFVVRLPESSASFIEGYSNLRLQLFALSGSEDPNGSVTESAGLNTLSATHGFL